MTRLKALDGRAKQRALEDFLEDELEFDVRLERMGIDLSDGKWDQYVKR